VTQSVTQTSLPTAVRTSLANQAFRKLAKRRMSDTIVSLCKAYKVWQDEHGLYLGDVPEIPEHLEDDLTTSEREWLSAFIQRWNAACDRERASAVAA
jgi:hypothetical protein